MEICWNKIEDARTSPVIIIIITIIIINGIYHLAETKNTTNRL